MEEFEISNETWLSSIKLLPRTTSSNTGFSKLVLIVIKHYLGFNILLKLYKVFLY